MKSASANKVKRYLAITVASISMLCLSNETYAAETDQCWLSFGGLSQHFSKQDELNQTNYGLGVEYRYAPDWYLVGGTFKNSTYQWSQYVGANWLPLEYSGFKFGVSGQLTNNYRNLNNGGIVPLIIPMMSMQYQRFGANVYLIPTLRNVTGSIAIQFKYQLQ